MTAPGGTVYWIISFHLSFVSVSLGDAVSDEYAAYPMETEAAVKTKPKPVHSHFLIPEKKSEFATVFILTGISA